MRFLLFLFTGLLLGGCTTADGQERSYIQSDRNLYYQQSVVHPLGQEPNATPYGTPANAGTSSDIRQLDQTRCHFPLSRSELANKRTPKTVPAACRNGFSLSTSAIYLDAGSGS